MLENTSVWVTMIFHALFDKHYEGYFMDMDYKLTYEKIHEYECNYALYATTYRITIEEQNRGLGKILEITFTMKWNTLLEISINYDVSGTLDLQFYESGITPSYLLQAFVQDKLGGGIEIERKKGIYWRAEV